MIRVEQEVLRALRLATDKAFCVPQKFALANAFLLMSAMK
jgi:hypothetical protein